MNLLILGGSGFVSGTLARLALARGHAVWTVTRGQRPPLAGTTALPADRHDPAAFRQAIRSAHATWDLAVDCIAFSPADARQDLAELPGLAAQLVFISTDFVYHPAQRRFPQPEAPAVFLEDGYGGLKRQAELVLSQAENPGMAWTVLRPCHIYGPGSLLGCLPAHGRDPRLIQRLRAGEPLELVGGGHFLQQPLLAGDLAETILSLAGNPAAAGQTFNVAGPEMVESREYYRLVAEILGVALEVRELPVDAFRAAHPEAASFLCHRIYDLSRLAASGASVPSTPLRAGLQAQVDALLADALGADA
ncbi:MAG: NAD-dependent epimerase/dehydratase family protein [Anaerolineaceae bacterium]|nr:NAD-dependent epimerase/dehydratase family protein [Anaerolineaceae bacterium]